jgi:hypothetical protein
LKLQALAVSLAVALAAVPVPVPVWAQAQECTRHQTEKLFRHSDSRPQPPSGRSIPYWRRDRASLDQPHCRDQPTFRLRY